jgi:hypothetical protein
VRRVGIVGLCLAAVLALGGAAASGASAHSFIWKVAGAKLEAGKTKEITAKVKTGSKYILKGTAVGIKTEVECTSQKLKAGSTIIGGTPGTSEETLELENCKALKPSGCTGVKVAATPAKNEIVEIASNKKLGILFKPKTGTVFTTISFEGCLLNIKAEVTGSAVAEVGSEETEATTGTLIFPSTQIKEIVKSNGTKETTGLKFAGNEATIAGETTSELSPSAAFGVF